MTAAAVGGIAGWGYKSSINPNTLRIPQLIAIPATPVPVPLSSPMANQSLQV